MCLDSHEILEAVAEEVSKDFPQGSPEMNWFYAEGIVCDFKVARRLNDSELVDYVTSLSSDEFVSKSYFLDELFGRQVA